jgi:hypothetical protein
MVLSRDVLMVFVRFHAGGVQLVGQDATTRVLVEKVQAARDNQQ